MRVGIVGCGAISWKYLTWARKFPKLEIAACADLNRSAAQGRATEFKIPKVLSVKELLADPTIQIVLNLTVPRAHAEITLAALAAGKHVYTEKPLGVTRQEGLAILKQADEVNRLVCGAPDTFLGSGLQTARAAIDAGRIGKPVAFTAFMMCPGHESWHPSPEFYYEIGGGPMLDMGPYYLTALLNLLGPVKRLTALASIAIPRRTIGSEPKKGKRIEVQTPDHIVGALEFEQGAVGNLVTSFATRFAPYDSASPITIFGTEGTLLVPDPNNFEGPVLLRTISDSKFRKLKPVFLHKYERSAGLAEMVEAIEAGRKPRCGGEQLFAVLDLMAGFLDSADSGKAYEPVSAYSRPVPLPPGLPFGVFQG
ncbi:MAG: Gfo/Idh/MocA family oxidoreductase [Tepidisphaeraceae bacterium]|jgi:predicted dehydrogenase